MADRLTISIVGLGLMGGSLALALRAAQPERWRNAQLVAVARQQGTLDAALAAGAIDAGTTDLAEGVRGADVVVLGAPVRTIVRLLPEVARHAAPGAVILDLGSSKVAICAAMAELPAHVEPIGGHPLCGKEVAGFGAAEATLYRGRPFVLCPLPRTAGRAVDLARELASALGARPMLAEPETHDCAVAAISHLPYLVAAALVGAVDADGDALAWTLAASGFRDTSRVAASDVEMMLDILMTNRPAVLDWLKNFGASLGRLEGALAAEDEETLRGLLGAARARRISAGKAMG